MTLVVAAAAAVVVVVVVVVVVAAVDLDDVFYRTGSVAQHSATT